MLDQIQERGLTRVDIVEDEHEGTLARGGFEEPADRPERLLAAGWGLRDAHQLRHMAAHELLVLLTLKPSTDLGLDNLGRVEVGQSGGLFDRLDDRVVGNALAIRETPAHQDRCFASKPGDELPYQTGFPHARRSEEGEELTPGVLDGGLVRLPELGELSFTPDHRGAQVPRHVRGHVPYAAKSPGRDTLVLAL